MKRSFSDLLVAEADPLPLCKVVIPQLDVDYCYEAAPAAKRPKLLDDLATLAASATVESPRFRVSVIRSNPLENPFVGFTHNDRRQRYSDSAFALRVEILDSTFFTSINRKSVDDIRSAIDEAYQGERHINLIEFVFPDTRQKVVISNFIQNLLNATKASRSGFSAGGPTDRGIIHLQHENRVDLYLRRFVYRARRICGYDAVNVQMMYPVHVMRAVVVEDIAPIRGDIDQKIRVLQEQQRSLIKTLTIDRIWLRVAKEEINSAPLKKPDRRRSWFKSRRLQLQQAERKQLKFVNCNPAIQNDDDDDDVELAASRMRDFMRKCNAEDSGISQALYIWSDTETSADDENNTIPYEHDDDSMKL